MNQALWRRVRVSIAQIRGDVAPIALFAALCLSLAACSSDTAGGDGAGTGAGSSGGAGCQGVFCLEDNQNIQVTPAKLAYADLAAGTEQTQEIAVINVGDRGTLKITAATFEPATTEFTLIDYKPVELPPGKHVKWKIRYKPLKTGARTIHLNLTNNSTDKFKRALRVPLQVKAAAGVLNATPDPLDFGPVASNQSAKKSTKIFNTGDKVLTVTSIDLAANESPDFKITKAPKAPFELKASASFEVEVEFSPSNGGIDTSHIVVGHTGGGQLKVTVTGSEIGPLIAIVPPELNFGQVADAAKVQRSFKIFSKGQADLHISKIELDPTSTYKKLFINESGPITLKPNTSQIVDVTLTGDKSLPKASAQVATILIHSDAPNAALTKVPVRVEAEPCVAGKSAFSVEASAAKGQVDIILAIDSSGSMKEEKKAVSSNLNAFAKLITSKNIDHHVVLIGKGMCVPPPLASAGCGNSKSFKHINVSVGSNDGLQKIVQTYSQWQGFLRAGAQKHFIMITDDNSKKDANWFTTELAKLKNPGFPGGFTFHSIVGWAPSPVPFIGCIGAAGHGTVYIELSKKTGGELASICATQLGVPPDWSKLFAAIGNNVVSTVKVVCQYALPAQKDGKAVDPATVSLTFKKSDGTDSTVNRVQGVGQCPSSSHGWYFDNNAKPTAAVLCPASCSQLKGNKLSFHFGC